MTIFTDYLESPLGLIECKASEKGITQVIFCGDEQAKANGNVLTEQCKSELTEYFAGERKHFDLPLDAQGTLFQQAVWQSLTTIPFGSTLSYGELAVQLQNPKAVRAVGGANGRNPISIIVPCHRVIGANGTLTGYAGGVERKLWLLRHEGIAVSQPASANRELDFGLAESANSANAFSRRQDKTRFLK